MGLDILRINNILILELFIKIISLRNFMFTDIFWLV